MTLLELQQQVRGRLEEAFPFAVWIVAEIAEMKVSYAGHCYLELVEKGTDDAVPRARASATIWQQNYRMLSAYFEGVAGRPLAAGLRLLLRARVAYHELYGLSLHVVDLDPSYTLGDVARARIETIERLRAEGVWDMNRSLGFPALVQRIALVSSRKAAGYQDFMRELDRAPYRFDVELFDAYMQGREAEETIVAALEAVASRMECFDALVLIRGGGAQSDLKCFDSYRLCCHLAQFPLPVLTGIGHDKDESIADLVAAERLKTPTAVAQWLVARMRRADVMDEQLEALRAAARARMSAERQRLMQQGLSLGRTVQRMNYRMSLRLERLRGALRLAASRLTERTQERRDAAGAALRTAVGARMMREHDRMLRLEQGVASRDPASILRLGFALVRHAGVVVRAASELHPGDPLRITLSAGEVNAITTDDDEV